MLENTDCTVCFLTSWEARYSVIKELMAKRHSLVILENGLNVLKLTYALGKLLSSILTYDTAKQ